MPLQSTYGPRRLYTDSRCKRGASCDKVSASLPSLLWANDSHCTIYQLVDDDAIYEPWMSSSRRQSHEIMSFEEDQYSYQDRMRNHGTPEKRSVFVYLGKRDWTYQKKATKITGGRFRAMQNDRLGGMRKVPTGLKYSVIKTSYYHLYRWLWLTSLIVERVDNDGERWGSLEGNKRF